MLDIQPGNYLETRCVQQRYSVISAAVALGAATGTVAVWKSDPDSKRRLVDKQTMRSLEE
ncbi:MAG TPA: hypothetical protein V6C95_11250 [Coleofasciculaceae cyanobacterium]